MRNSLVNILGRTLPLNAISYLAGKASEISLPGPLNVMLLKGFAGTFGIDLSEAEKPVEFYHNIAELFARRLKPGARPISGDITCPADGVLSMSGPAENGSALQVKGMSYSLKELMYGEADPKGEPLKYFATIYLAPHNYHRVHSPVAGTLRTIRYFPGELWPVNKPSVRFTPRLFTRNERLVFEIETDKGLVQVAMVGALNVGKMTSPFLGEFATNKGLIKSGNSAQVFYLDQPQTLSAGQEIGTFMLGSTVIIAFDESMVKGYRIREAWQSRVVRMGEALAKFEPAN